MNISVLGFYRNIDRYFDKNVKIIQNSQECLRKLKNKNKISK